MKNLLKLEEMAMAAIVIYLLVMLNADWWWYLLFVFGPDISMIGYLAGNKVGAASYNLFHHKAVAISIIVVGLLFSNELVELIGLIMFGHSSMDRMFGYGLKTEQGFKYTHLGKIGEKSI